MQWDWIWLDNLPVLQFQDSYDGQGNLIGTAPTYLHPDQLGTPRLWTNSTGTESGRYRSDAFGKATALGTNMRLRLPGQVALGFQGINYNYFRDYDPNAGRYLESDSIGLSGGLNSYEYAENNPSIFADPDGLEPRSPKVQNPNPRDLNSHTGSFP